MLRQPNRDQRLNPLLQVNQLIYLHGSNITYEAGMYARKPNRDQRPNPSLRGNQLIYLLGSNIAYEAGTENSDSKLVIHRSQIVPIPELRTVSFIK